MKLIGVIIRISQYKDNDAMINVLSKDKVISFYARGVFKTNSKTAILNSLLSYGEFTFLDYKDLFSFKEFSPIIDMRNYLNEFGNLVAINFINEVTLKLYNDEDMINIYPYLIDIIKRLSDKKISVLLLLKYLCISLRLTGFGLEVDKCVITGEKKDIVGISFVDGGFVARNAYKPNIHKIYSPNECILVRKLFKKEISDISKEEYKNEEVKKIFIDMLIYTYNQTGIRFISEPLVLKLL